MRLCSANQTYHGADSIVASRFPTALPRDLVAMVGCRNPCPESALACFVLFLKMLLHRAAVHSKGENWDCK